MIESNLYESMVKYLPIVCVDVCIQNKNKNVLLIKRKDEPAKDKWWFPGGRLYKNESIAECAIRKAKEEVGLDCAIVKKLDTKETIFNTGYHNIPIHTVNIIVLLELIDSNQPVILDQYSSEYQWFNDILDEITEDYVRTILFKVIPPDPIKMQELMKLHPY